MGGFYQFGPNGVSADAPVEQAFYATTEEDSETSPTVRIRIAWSGPGGDYDSVPELASDLQGAFATKGVDTFITVVSGAEEAPTLLQMNAGESRLGPFPIADAARHVEPAVQAARIAHEPFIPREHRW